MVKPLLVVAVLAVSVMVGVQRGWVHVSGMSGSCSQAVRNSDGTVLEACHRGWLAGWPSLASHNCTVASESGKYQYWRCPTPIEASQVGR